LKPQNESTEQQNGQEYEPNGNADSIYGCTRHKYKSKTSLYVSHTQTCSTNIMHNKYLDYY